ncbi:hypothetical protein N8467_00470 [bacterium]|nr:hypothetical protein [bacterium]
MKNKMLVIYNTCGIRRDNTKWYIECIKSILKQKFDSFRVVLSSCKNSKECIIELNKEFGNRISYSIHAELNTVNITFNKAVRDSVKEFGEFETYLYVDSGCTFDDQEFLLKKLYETHKHMNYGMVSTQSDTDEALQVLDEKFTYQSPEVQIKNEDYLIPIGKAINVHTHLYSNAIFQRYGSLCPDVFAAFCTESVFSFVCASVGAKWVIMKDCQVRHQPSIDGASAGFSHHSRQFLNSWNNLLFGRDAMEFLNDKEAYEVGLGYEECNNIMNHNPEAYTKDGIAKYPEKLAQKIEKYFYLTEIEMNYNKLKSVFIP